MTCLVIVLNHLVLLQLIVLWDLCFPHVRQCIGNCCFWPCLYLQSAYLSRKLRSSFRPSVPHVHLTLWSNLLTSSSIPMRISPGQETYRWLDITLCFLYHVFLMVNMPLDAAPQPRHLCLQREKQENNIHKPRNYTLQHFLYMGLTELAIS